MSKKIFVALSFIYLIFQLNVYAQQSEVFPSIEPYIVFNQKSENLSPQEMIFIALTFSEYPLKTDLSKYMEKFYELEKRVSTKYFKSLSQEEQAEEILLIMYEKTLRRYELKQTRLTTLFDEGTYNCVSSSVLYMALAKAAGLKVVGNRAPDHLFCSVIIDGQKYDVETTNPMGFNPGQKKMMEQNGSGTKYAVVPKKTYNGRYVVSDKMAVSLVARNITAAQIDKRNYSIAVPVAAARLVFLENESDSVHNDSRIDFDMTVSNYAAELQNKKRYYEGMLWMDSVISRWGMSEGLLLNYGDAIYNAVLYLTDSGQTNLAEEKLELHKSYLKKSDYEDLCGIIFVKRTILKSNELKSFDEKIEYLKSRKKENSFSNKYVSGQIGILLENEWIKKISSEMQKNNFLVAAGFADRAIADVPTSSNLKKIKQTCLNNYDITIHNKFAELANRQDYIGARKILEEGLKNRPDSSTLKNDLTRLGKLGY